MFSTMPATSSLTLSAISAARRATFCAVACGVVTIRNCACGQQLGERHRHVAGARRQVDEQVVQLAPLDVLEELGEGLVEHRPAPDDGGVLVEEEADRHDLDAVGLGGTILRSAVDGRALGAEAEHARDGVAPHVRVEHADALALAGQRGGEVGGDGRLADAALAGADADDVLDGGERAVGQAAAAGRACAAARASRSSVSTSKATLTPMTPSSARTACVTFVWKVLRIGHPAVVSDTMTSTTPVAWMSIDRTMSSVTMSLCSSGSMTALRASRTWSLVGMTLHSMRPGEPSPEGMSLRITGRNAHFHAEEAAAVVAAIEQFLRDTTPSPAEADATPSGWLRAARLEAVDRDRRCADARRLLRAHGRRRPARQPRGGRPARARRARRLGDRRGQGRLAQPPRPLLPAGHRAAGGPRPDDPGHGRRRHRPGRQRGRRPRRRRRPGLARRRDAGPDPHAALRAAPGHAGRAGRRPAAQPRPQAGGARASPRRPPSPPPG